jgi:very-short-patch-repair endonuclease
MERLESASNFRQAIGRKGGLTRAKAFTREYQQRARAHVRRESNVANGRLGGKAYVRKYGKKSLVERARQYRLDHPSNLERAVREALHRIGVHDFEREAYIFPKSKVHAIIGDFVFRRAHAVVYADGETWHQNLPSLARCADSGTRDEHYDNYLRYQGWRVLRLSEHEIERYERDAKLEPQNECLPLLQKLRAFVRECGAYDGECVRANHPERSGHRGQATR